jgi:hypothetical protein
MQRIHKNEPEQRAVAGSSLALAKLFEQLK